MSIAEGYIVTLTCDYCPPNRKVLSGTYYGLNKGGAYKEVRAAGWRTYPAQQLAKCRRCIFEKNPVRRIESQKERQP